jgi:ubiquinone/menaquinone biosynthesis C-methylase UbiE
VAVSERSDRDRTLAASRRGFDKWAPTYEEDRRSRFNARSQAAAFDALELEADDRLLDVGCGSGAAVRRAAPVVSRAVGVDLSPAMIERAQQLAAGLDGVEFHVAESSDLPFEDGSFTAVLCTTSFHHYPDPAASVREMARVLAPEGRLLIGDPSSDRWEARLADVLLRRFDESHVRLYRASELAAFMYGAGLESVAVRRLRSGAYAIVRARKSGVGPVTTPADRS